MFNFFKKVKSEIKQSFSAPVDVNAVIAEIHNEFDTASERLLKEAKVILSSGMSTEKGETLTKLGFGNAKPSVEVKEVIETKKEMEMVARRIEHFNLYYPMNKYITEKEVERVCKKYGLLCGESMYYTGDVPDKNVKEIADFKLREEDGEAHFCRYYKYEMGAMIGFYRSSSKEENGTYGYTKSTRFGNELVRVRDEKVAMVYEKPSFKICATVKDFNMDEMRVTDGYKLEQNLPDPIVLQPVSGGYLIVSKWGLEGQDESLVNEKMN